MSIVFGIHAVEAALKQSAIAELWLAESQRPNARLNRLLDQAKRAGVRIQHRPREALDQLVQGERHQGVVARLAAVEPAARPPDLMALIDGLDHAPLLLVLDGVTDPHNLGACLRSANAAGVDAVIVPKDKAVGLTPVVRKVACGAAETTPFYQVTNLARTLRELQQAGVWLVGAAGEAGASLYETDLRGPLALMLGSEGKGLRRLTREHCDLLVKIPMAGAVESLNVSVATGICLFEALRQRSAR
ncbi:23S rRNA methyltransferase [Candidatus Tenderia electrophaga]|jgi:23S rRNA (guanosine2251-2'-O)-methyltransferase|uniref:23S rRNA (guanosine-2'-O-)-methyltransferase RlmB n=1 Tax=Candidatus Tenderia electrophaga TaxID=1748243 RepID=A0A0S2TCY3_9GAMM|nr:23S rRNA methyltransferase [Candidatus Tenderia electrophaga]